MKDRLFQTMTEMFDQSLKLYAKKTACFWKSAAEAEVVSYAELNAEGKKLADALIVSGVEKGDKIMLQLPTPGQYSRAFWGIQYAGAVPMALPFAMGDAAGRDVLDKQLNICRDIVRLTILIPEASLKDYQKAIAPFENITLMVYEDLMEKGRRIGNTGMVYPKITPEDECCILFSSGSTDLPKGVVLKQKTMAASICSALSIMDYDDSERSLSWLPLTHAFGFIGFHLIPIAKGASQGVMPPPLFVQHPDWFLRQVSDRRITVLGGMNFALKLLDAAVSDADLETLNLSCVKNFFLGAEPVNAELADHFAGRFAAAGLSPVALRTAYGLSESAFAVSLGKAGKPMRVDCLDFDALGENRAQIRTGETNEHRQQVRYASVGTPVPGLKVLVADDEGHALPEETVGELCYAGESISERYFFRQNEMQKRMVGEYLASGDMGYLSDGEIIITGRKKDIIFINGQNYYPLDIENRIARIFPALKDRIVASQIYNRHNEPELVLFIQSRQATADFAVKIRQLDLAIKQEQFIAFDYYLPIEAIPKTNSGKIQRSALIKQYQDGVFEPIISDIRAAIAAEDETDAVVFGDSLSMRLQDLWNESVQSGGSRHSKNFFEAGGSSIVLMQLATKLQVHFGIRLSLKALMRVFDVKSFVALVKAHMDEATAPVCLSVEPDPAHRAEPFALTDIQRAYLLGREEAFDMGGISTHGYYEYRTDLDLARFEDALNRVIAHQDNMRLVMTEDHRQQILQAVPHYHIEVIDGRGEDAETLEAIRAEERARMSHAVFAADHWPLFELKALRISDRESDLFLGIDLLIMDASSIEMFKRELLWCYDHPGAMLEPLAFTFRDFMRGIDAIHASEQYAKDKAFWKERAAAIPPAPQLPVLKDTTAAKTAVFKRLSLTLSPGQTARLRALATANGISLSSVICTAYALALSAYANQPRCTLNVTIFNKYDFHPDVARMMGDFTSTMLLPFNFADNPTIKTVFQAIQDEIFCGLEHRYYTGVEWLRDIKREQGTGNKAAMPIVFTSTLDQADAPAVELGDLQYAISQTSQVYLDCQARETPEGILVTWDYLQALFDDDLMRDMFALFEHCLQRLDQAGNVADYLQPSEACREKWKRYNETAAPIPRTTLYQLFADSVAGHGASVAVQDAAGFYTYAQLHEAAGCVASWLAAKGVSKGDYVGVMGHRRKETIAAMLGVLKIGAAYVPLDPENPESRRQKIVTDAGCRLVIDSMDAFDTNGLPRPKTAADPEAVAYAIYTSGSTGRPKGVVITNKAAVNTILDVNQRYGVGSEDCFIGLSSICFDLSVYDIFGSLAAGARLVMVQDPRNVREVAALVANEAVTVWNSVPAFMQMYAEELSRQSSRGFAEAGGRMITVTDNLLRLAILSGDWIPVGLPGTIMDLLPGIEVVSMGGATEASIWSIEYPICEIRPDWQSIPYGMPLANQQFYVLNYTGALCPPDVEGELFIGGAGVAQAYLNDPVQTAASFIEHPALGRLYRTGDMGRLHEADEETYIIFSGRKDTQVKIRGHRIELGEIEKALTSLDGIDESAAVVQARGQVKEISAFVVSDKPVDTEAVKAGLKEQLPNYMVPAAVVALDALPLTVNGKVDRKQLAEAEVLAGSGAQKQPATPLETQIRRIWSRVLAADGIGVDQNFYDIGGDSIKLFTIINEVESHYQLKFPREQYFAFETIEEMADIVAEHGE
ncbi:putative bacitracin synthetase 1 [Pseudoramibacter alactolyticus ATCC 23263]|uniref:Putative bacitracin synthetase 1 n=1 Tax=Pseudoramibacter alactolyticus ATCC 23263 TaxID=887929 RepID=E6MFW5_9FIRM|nr:non-ribosomal peptide synthetase [Pseudoramibacter alactolyticus]EFV02110.1 putative bacitracin synthetase 1 [Pseudoramibacter alactolyticus ATCC 23263]